MTARTLWTALLVLVLAGIAAFVRFTPDASELLPQDGDARAALSVARDFEVAGTLLFAVDGEGRTRAEHRAAVQALADGLRGLDGIERVRAGYDLREGARLEAAARPHAVALVPAEEMAERLSEEGLTAVFQAQLQRLSGPGAALFARRFEEDPLDVGTLALDSLRASAEVRAADGLLLDESGRYALVVAQPSVGVGETGPGDPFVASVEAVVASVGAPVAWFGGHRIAEATASGIQGDVQLASFVGLALLVVVLVVGFRSLRPILGALLPVGLVALGGLAGAALFSPVHGMVLAFGASVLGLGVDYWVHLYLHAAASDALATRSERFAAATGAARRLLPAFALSAGSTGLAFAALWTSQTPLLRALGGVGVLAIVGALGGALLAGPLVFALLGPRRRPAERTPPRLPVYVGPLNAILLGGLVLFAPNGSFDADPMALVSRPPAVRQDAAVLAQAFGLTESRALVLVEGDVDAVRDQATRVTAALAGTGFPPRGPGAALPGPDTVAARAAALPAIPVLQARIDAAAQAAGFAPLPGLAARLHAQAAPVPLGTWDDTPVHDEITSSLRVEGDTARALLSLPLHQAEAAPALRDTVRAVAPDARVLVPTAITADALEDAQADLLWRGALALLGVLGLFLLRYRAVVPALSAAAPATVGVLSAAGLMALTGSAWNPVNQALLVLVLGLGIDFGVFVVEARRREGTLDAVTGRAVLLGSATTLAGFAPLLLTSTPALSGIGVVVCAGVGSAALMALVVLPWLGRSPRGQAWSLRVVFAVVAFFCVDLLYNQWMAFPQPASRPEAPSFTLSDDGRERTFGPNRLVRAEGVWTLSTTGSPYEVGYASGVLTADLRERLERELFAQFEAIVSNPVAQWLIVRGAQAVGVTLDDSIPTPLLVELQGTADSVPDQRLLAGPIYSRKLYYHAVHDLGQALVDTPLLGCTGFMAGPGATADGHWLMGRNFDFDGGVAFDRDKVVRVHRPDDGHAFLSVGFAGFLGAVSGVNEHGLAVTINAAGSDATIRPGEPMTLIVREMLQHASSLDEAEALLDARRGFVAENVMVIDGDAGEAALFEVAPDRVERVPVDRALAVANHFRADAFKDDATNQRRIEELTSVPRQARMEELLDRHAGSLDLRVATDIMTDSRGVGDTPLPTGHRHAIDAALSTHSFVVDATDRVVLVSRYPSPAGGYVRYALDEALQGDIAPTSFTAPDGVDEALSVRTGRELLRRSRRVSASEAEPMVRQAVALMPGHPEAMLELGRVLIAQGAEASGREWLVKAREAGLEYAHQEREVAEILGE